MRFNKRNQLLLASSCWSTQMPVSQCLKKKLMLPCINLAIIQVRCTQDCTIIRELKSALVPSW